MPLWSETSAAVRVFEHEPGLLRYLEPAKAEEVRRRGVARAVTLPPGPWATPRDQEDRFAGYLGLLVIDGLLTRNVRLPGISAPELLGAGDLLRPWQEEHLLSMSLPVESDWRILTETRIAVLDERFARAICAFPGVVAAIVERTTERSRWLSLQVAIAHLRRVDQRLLLVLWYLADRWGKVHADGVHLPMRLTHAFLADIIGAQRPSVTLAINQLVKADRMHREGGGSWVLHPPAPTIESILGETAARRSPDGDG